MLDYCQLQMTLKKSLYSASELAEILGVSRQEIVRRIWRGFIKAEKVGHQYIITAKEFSRIKDQQGKK